MREWQGYCGISEVPTHLIPIKTISEITVYYTTMTYNLHTVKHVSKPPSQGITIIQEREKKKGKRRSLELESPIVHTQRLARSFHTVVHHRRRAPTRDILGQLLHIRRAREKQDQVLREGRKFGIQRLQRVGLHGLQIEDLIRSVSGAYTVKWLD